MEAHIDISEFSSVEISHGYNADEHWTFGDSLTLSVSDEISQGMAKQLVLYWLRVMPDADELTDDEFWLWLGDAAETIRRWDGGYILKKDRKPSQKPCIGDFY